jgi:hypothetical protein
VRAALRQLFGHGVGLGLDGEDAADDVVRFSVRAIGGQRAAVFQAQVAATVVGELFTPGEQAALCQAGRPGLERPTISCICAGLTWTASW